MTAVTFDTLKFVEQLKAGGMPENGSQNRWQNRGCNSKLTVTSRVLPEF